MCITPYSENIGDLSYATHAPLSTYTHMLTTITLRDMRFYAYHGVLPQEKSVGNTFTVTLELRVDVARATITDDLNDTVDYSQIYRLVEEEMATPSLLIEHVAGRIMRSLHQHFPTISHIRIELCKEQPPFKAQISGACITLEESYTPQ